MDPPRDGGSRAPSIGAGGVFEGGAFEGDRFEDVFAAAGGLEPSPALRRDVLDGS